VNDTQAVLARRLEGARRAAGVSQTDAARAVGVSDPTYLNLEQGTRAMKADELIRLADRFGVRSASIGGIEEAVSRARFAERPDGSDAAATMRDRAYAYIELDAYLTGLGIPDA
jgi:DNA-binding XRE family transcriptional regulator